MPDRPERTPLGKLIVKAAWSIANAGLRPNDRLRQQARLNAYGQVAADVLDACPAPFAFEQAVAKAVLDLQLPWRGLRPDVLDDRTAEWEEDVITQVLGYAGLTDRTGGLCHGDGRHFGRDGRYLFTEDEIRVMEVTSDEQ